MSEIIDKGMAIYRSPRKSYRFSPYQLDEKGMTVLGPNGIPLKYYCVCTNREFKTSDVNKIRSIDAWIAHHTQTSKKSDGTEVKSCSVEIRKYTEAEALRLMEPDAVALKDESGNDIKVSMDELKKAYLEAKAKQPLEEKAST